MNAKINIRKARVNDIPEIVRIHRACVSQVNSKSYSSEQIVEWLEQITEDNVAAQLGSSDWYVGEVESKIVGFAQVDFEKSEICQINIRPEFEGRGFGRVFLEFLENEFRKRGLREINLNATKDAEGFYRHLGFEGDRNITYRLATLSLDLVLMKKHLDINLTKVGITGQ